jgi:23S rRNA pseudouridine1911/1915/1917 synthase
MNKIVLICQEGPIRVDKFIAVNMDKSRSEVQKYFEESEVLVNGKVVKGSLNINSGDTVEFEVSDAVEAKIEKQNIELDVVYEDSDVIVVNKPTGMVVHPANGHYNDTLVNALMYHCTDLSSINGEIRPGIVHRIDKDTSGLLVACKNDFAHNSIAEQLKAKTSTRKYIAIVYGNFDHNFGKIEAPIARDPQNRLKMAVVKGGKESVTTFKVLERFGEYTLLELKLETGRTHQIRVHMSYIGHPVLGDPLYGPKKVIGEYGQYLHAKTLGFKHPRTNEYMEFTSELPDFFLEMIEELKK